MASPPRPTTADCFCAGVRLMTLRGEVPVESVRVGDRAVTLSGNGTTLKPVTWIARRSVDLDRHPRKLAVAPVRIRAGAIEEGMPIRDLLLSPGHALSVEDENGERVLIPARDLANGATILREPAIGEITYFQVAVELPDILMADGMAVESSPDGGDGAAREGAVVPFARPGAATSGDDADTWFAEDERAEPPCAPVRQGHDALPVHARLMQRAEALGYRLTDDPALEILADDVTLAALSEADGEYLYLLPPGTGLVRLRSRSRVPAETDPAGGDTRRLGVALGRLLHDGVALPIEDACFTAGFLPAEGEGSHRWRWTIGEAELTLPKRDEETTLELHVHIGWSRYWWYPPENPPI